MRKPYNTSLRKPLLLFVLLLFLPPLQAQVKYPVTVSGFHVRPSLFLDDYVLPGTRNMMASILLNDLHETDGRQVFLRFGIESAAVKIQMRSGYIPQETITIFPGELQTLADYDFFPWFNLHVWASQGISRTDMENGVRLPDGFYRFTLEVCDARSGKAISNQAMFSAKIEQYAPPVLMYPSPKPVRQSEILIRPEAQNIFFQWQMNSPEVNMTNTEYELELYEVATEEKNPKASVENHTARQIFRSDPVSTLSYNFTTGDAALELGKRYAYRVAARDKQGRDVFRNQGFSETAFFYYGYPEGGKIPLLLPEHKGAFTYMSIRNLQWGAADNLIDEQPVRYHLRVAGLPENDHPENAIQSGAPFVDYETAEAVSQYGLVYSLQDKNLGNSASYVWQVKAWTGTQEIAESEIRIFEGPPVIPHFSAGGHRVTIIKTANTELKNLTGEGEMTINAEGQKHKVSFKNVEITDVNGMLLLTKGSIVNRLQNFGTIELSPTTESNGQSVFVPDSFRLDPDGLWLKGVIEWTYPFPVDSKEKPMVRTQPRWYDYNNFKILGTGNLDSRNDFTLLEPGNFRMKLQENSEVRVYDNRYTFYMRGYVETPQAIQGSKEERYHLHFHDLHQLFYNTIENYSHTNLLHLIPQNTELYLSPKTWTLDLSDTESCGKMIINPGWKGVYINDFEVQYTPKVDAFRQIYMAKLVSTRRVTDDDATVCMIDPKGLQMEYTTGFAVSDTAFFNTFPSALSNLTIDIRNSKVRSGHLKGSIYIPVISHTRQFSWTVPVTTIGFQTGYLDEDLSDFPFVFNENGGEQKLHITIRRAVFEERKRLNMDVDIDWPHIGVKFTALPYFRIWGDYNIGFVEPNGTISLAAQKQGIVNGFEINVDHIGCGRQANLYSIGASSTIVLGEDVAGPEGPAVSNFYSVLESPLLSGAWAASGVRLENELLQENEQSSITGSDMGEAPAAMSSSEIAAHYAQVEQYYDAVNNAYSELDEALATQDSLYVYEPAPDPYSIDWYLQREELPPMLDVTELEVNNLQQLIEILDVLSMFLDERRRETYLQLREAALMLEEQTEEFITTYRQLTGMKDQAIATIYTRYGKMKNTVVRPLKEQTDKVKYGIASGLDKGVDAAFGVTSKLVDNSLENIEKICLSAASYCPEGMNASAYVSEAISVSREEINKAVRESMEAAVYNNIMTQVSYLCDTVLVGTVEDMMDIAVKSQIDKLLAGEISEISLEGTLGEMDEVLKKRWEDIQHMFSGDNLAAMLANTGKDVVRGIDWEKVGQDIIEKMLDDTFTVYTDKKAEELYDNFVHAVGEETIAGQLLSKVPLNFTNVADNLVNGRIDKIIVFDRVPIEVKSKVADFTGYVEFRKDDPEWGDIFTAELRAKIKMQPEFEVNALYINGSVDDAGGSYKYWFLDIGAKGLNVPVGTTGLTLDGASGKVYHHLSRTPETPYRPDRSNKFGIGLTAYFFDTAGKGDMILFDCGLEAAFFDDGFDMTLDGNVLVGNQISDGKAQKTIVNGTGYLYFSSRENAFIGKFRANVDVGVICASGEMGMEFRPGFWEVYLGKREIPIQVSLLCARNPQFYGWFHVNKQMIDLGLAVNLDLNLRGPRINIGVAKFTPWARLAFDFGASTKVYLKPIKLAEAHVWLDLFVGVGIDYSTLVKSGSITLVGVNLGGEVLFISEPGPDPPKETSISGKLYGKVTVIGISFGFNLQMEKEF